jgi:lysophospholipase L1-like esterase
MELAISDDGAIVVITGLNAGFSVIAVDSECGEPLVPPIRRIFLEKSSRCQQTGNVISNFVSGYRYAAHPLLNAQGTVLKVQVIDHEYRRHLLALKPWGFPSAATLEYLALGDSFTSGEGETNDGHYLLGTNREFDRCHLSDRSYPFLIAAAQGIAIHHVESVACSGARMNDIVATSPYEGQGNRLGEGGWNWNSMLIKQRQEEALEGFFPGRILQSQFVDAYQPRAITIGIGGNDAGFMDKLRACVMPGTCEWVSNPALRMRVGEEIARQFAALRELFQRILSLSPLSQLFVFGYPQIVTDEGRGCDLLTAHLLNLEEREFMSQGVHYLNQVIRAAAQSVNVPYIDIESSFHGARLCEIAKKSAVNGVRLGDDLAPIASLPMLRIIGNESFHPTPYGHELIAATFRRLVPDLRENTTCECVPSTTLPPTPAYWTGQNTADEPALWAESFANVEYDSGEKRLAVYVPEGSLLPHSVAHLTIAGREGELEIVTVGSKGEIVANIVLPQSLQRGYHTVHVYGTSFSGERINLYQAIAVSEAEPMEEPVRVDTGKDSNLDHEQSLPKETPPHLAPRIIPLNTEATQVLGITTFHMRDTVQGRYSELVVPGIIIILCVFVFIYIRGRGG